jgi:hypothetical protein
MEEIFPEMVRANLGYPQDLFCGSGNSIWYNEDNPGEEVEPGSKDAKFYCSPVRFVIDDVKRAPEGDSNPMGVLALNEERLMNAEALYGNVAEYWLGLQDTIKECPPGATCIFNIGGFGTTVLPLEEDNPLVP